MQTQELLSKLCRAFEQEIPQPDPKNRKTVEFFCGISIRDESLKRIENPSFDPVMIKYTELLGPPPSLSDNVIIASISISGTPVLMESEIIPYREGKNLTKQQCEEKKEKICKRLLFSAFRLGLTSSVLSPNNPFL